MHISYLLFNTGLLEIIVENNLELNTDCSLRKKSHEAYLNFMAVCWSSLSDVL